MPIYEYKCRKCGLKFELLQSLGATNEGMSCPIMMSFLFKALYSSTEIGPQQSRRRCEVG